MVVVVAVVVAVPFLFFVDAGVAVAVGCRFFSRVARLGAFFIDID